MDQYSITFAGVPLQVWGNYTNGERGDYEYPGRSAQFEACEVYAGGETNIIELIDEHIEEIERITLEHIEG